MERDGNNPLTSAFYNKEPDSSSQNMSEQEIVIQNY